MGLRDMNNNVLLHVVKGAGNWLLYRKTLLGVIRVEIPFLIAPTIRDLAEYIKGDAWLSRVRKGEQDVY